MISFIQKVNMLSWEQQTSRTEIFYAYIIDITYSVRESILIMFHV